MRLAALRAFPVGMVALLVLLAPPSASACNCPTVGATDSAAPGDTVSYTLSNLSDGAEYSIRVNDDEIVPPTIAHTSSVSGTFEMPAWDGSSRAVSVQAVVNHVDLVLDDCNPGEQPFDSVVYSIPKAPSDTPAAAPPEPRRVEAPERTTRADGGRERHRPVARGPHQPFSSPRPTVRQPSSPEVPATQPVEHGVADSTAGAGEAAVAAPTTERPTSVARPAERKRAQSPVRRGGAVAGPPMPSTPARSVATDGTARVGTVRDGLQPAAVIALGVLLLAGLAGGGWAFVRTRLRGPTPEPEAAADVAAPPEVELLDLDAELERLVASEVVTVDLEAELQRMIAEGQQPADEAGLPASGAASSSV